MWSGGLLVIPIPRSHPVKLAVFLTVDPVRSGYGTHNTDNLVQVIGVTDVRTDAPNYPKQCTDCLVSGIPSMEET